jgi:inner membrane transporter RhtA
VAASSSAAIAAGLFASLGVMGVSGLRMTLAAVVLLVLARPTVHGRSRRAWAGIIVYGLAMATMNLLFYSAVERVPLGVAVTLEYGCPWLRPPFSVSRSPTA